MRSRVCDVSGGERYVPLESRFDADAGREACAFGCVDVGTLPCFLVCVHFVDFFFVDLSLFVRNVTSKLRHSSLRVSRAHRGARR